MYAILSEITRYAERHENRNHGGKKNQPIQTNQELPEMLQLSKDIKIVFITIIWVLKKLSRDMKKNFFKNTQIKLLDLKTIVTEMINILGGSNARLDIVGEEISELEDIALQALQHEIYREKRLQKMDQITCELWGTFKQPSQWNWNH